MLVNSYAFHNKLLLLYIIVLMNSDILLFGWHGCGLLSLLYYTRIYCSYQGAVERSLSFLSKETLSKLCPSLSQRRERRRLEGFGRAKPTRKKNDLLPGEGAVPN